MDGTDRRSGAGPPGEGACRGGNHPSSSLARAVPDLRRHFIYVLRFADPGERAASQAMLMGSVTAVITLLMLLLVFFNSPHGSGVGRLQPTAMERTIDLIETQLAGMAVVTTPPCDERGYLR
jgi:hypothetical protein